VVYEAASGFAQGFYILSGPNSDESICIGLLPPGVSFGYPQGSEIGVHEDRIFALASMMLQEMGWADQPDEHPARNRRSERLGLHDLRSLHSGMSQYSQMFLEGWRGQGS